MPYQQYVSVLGATLPRAGDIMIELSKGAGVRRLDSLIAWAVLES